VNQQLPGVAPSGQHWVDWVQAPVSSVQVCEQPPDSQVPPAAQQMPSQQIRSVPQTVSSAIGVQAPRFPASAQVAQPPQLAASQQTPSVQCPD
jgi:hypothetical protein